MKTKNSLGSKKILTLIIRKILYVFAIILIIYNVLYIINITMYGKKYISIFGKIYIEVQKDTSMKPTINKNDLMFITKEKIDNIKVDDIIGYDINNEIIFHRVINIDKQNNTYYFQTKADNYYHNDLEKKTKDQIKGKILFKIPILGLIFRGFENKIVTVIIMIILFFKFSFNNYRHLKSKKIRKQRSNT